MTIEEFWQKYLKESGINPKERYCESFYFDDDEQTANELLELVLCGKKKATSSSALYYQLTQTPTPKKGDKCIVTDWAGNPRCVIETTSVIHIPFKEMTFEIAKREGEDENLDSWIKNHIKFFTNDAEQVGYEFNEDMIVVFEDFEVVFRG
ncbi:MAG: ASCH domain-containing protein [Eubacteriaceae bacterium]|nr:ASCH domain-containing protein [Eubacteriaceae bacterium]